MAAIANAIARATGLRMGRLPMSPGAILEALWAKDGDPTGLQAAD
jgi:CO/xanthine dehydrogenase Mo-binding subunit